MLHSTTGIVLHQTEYSETSLIVKAYTREFGIQSFMIKGVRRKGSGMKRNLFGPLSMVDFIAYGKEQSGLHLVKDASCHRQFHSISTDIRKSSVLIFMNELIYKSITGEMPDASLFTFIYDSVIGLDQEENTLELVPLRFAIRLTSLLGIGPQHNYSGLTPVFDMQEGCFVKAVPGHTYYIDPPASLHFYSLLGGDEVEEIPIRHTERTYLLSRLMEYYRLHLPAFGEMKSHQVLSIVLKDPVD